MNNLKKCENEECGELFKAEHDENMCDYCREQKLYDDQAIVFDNDIHDYDDALEPISQEEFDEIFVNDDDDGPMSQEEVFDILDTIDPMSEEEFDDYPEDDFHPNYAIEDSSYLDYENDCDLYNEQ